jgi:hypothetical protein
VVQNARAGCLLQKCSSGRIRTVREAWQMHLGALVTSGGGQVRAELHASFVAFSACAQVYEVADSDMDCCKKRGLDIRVGSVAC